MTGKLALSKSGHDKNHLYVIVREEEEYVLLADGKLKLKERPKRKNRKHIQIIKELPPAAAELLADIQTFGDLEIKRAIKLYTRSDRQESGGQP